MIEEITKLCQKGNDDQLQRCTQHSRGRVRPVENISDYLQNLQNISDYLQNLQIIIKIFTISTINIVENINIIGCLGNYIIGH